MSANQMAWWTTFTHWGLGRVAPYYYFRRNGGILPDDYTFNKGTIREDVRDPLQYFGLFYANWGQFSQFKIKVNVETWYDKLYKQECSRIEWQFIQSWKFVKELKKETEDLKAFRLKAKEEDEKRVAKILKKSSKIDLEYKKLHGRISSGDFLNIHDVFRLWLVPFKKLMKDLSKDKKISVKVGKKEVQFGKSVLVVYVISSIIFCIGFIFGVLCLVLIIIGIIKLPKMGVRK
jgi:hypothetical protein